MKSFDDRSYLQVHMWRSTSRKMTYPLFLCATFYMSGAVCHSSGCMDENEQQNMLLGWITNMQIKNWTQSFSSLSVDDSCHLNLDIVHIKIAGSVSSDWRYFVSLKNKYIYFYPLSCHFLFVLFLFLNCLKVANIQFPTFVSPQQLVPPPYEKSDLLRRCVEHKYLVVEVEFVLLQRPPLITIY